MPEAEKGKISDFWWCFVKIHPYLIRGNNHGTYILDLVSGRFWIISCYETEFQPRGAWIWLAGILEKRGLPQPRGLSPYLWAKAGDKLYCFSNAIGHVLVTWENGEKKYPFGKKITAGPGKVKVSIHAGCVEAFPCAYVQGEVIHSDKTWMAEDYSQPLVPVGVCKYFTKPEQKPTVWEIYGKRV